MYLQQIAFKSDKLGIGWDISTVIGRLKSFRAGEEIKGLDDLEKGLECMEEDIYSVGGGYFKSFSIKNMDINYGIN